MIDVLMSTYNGARFLESQIDSILVQDYRDIRLLVRDDGSTDETCEIVQRYAATDHRVKLVEDNYGNLRAFSSFMKLVELSEAPYFMYADQDDVWLPDRVSKMLAAIRSIEAEAGSGTPTVVFSDLTIADEDLNVIDPSLWHFQQFDPNISRNWRHLLAQNVVLGCAMIANAAARKISLPYKLTDMPHDQWVALNASRFGRIEFIREATILYRQHGNNHSGANSFRLSYALERLPGLRHRFTEYRNAARVFEGVSVAELLWNKLRLNFRRFRIRDRF